MSCFRWRVMFFSDPCPRSDCARRLQAYGFKMPSFSANPYRPCLQEYYADWAPEKLGALDETLAKYEDKERQLFGALKNKYGKPVNFARCAPPKEK